MMTNGQNPIVPKSDAGRPRTNPRDANTTVDRTSDDGLSAFLAARPRLFGIAYRMLGSAAEAEDIVQDAWLRWQTANRAPIRNPLAFLITATTRLAINVLQSAHIRRETSAPRWLPESPDATVDPVLAAERAETMSVAVLVLLARLSPAERAAYVLREAFSYPYREIASIVRVEEANARQLVSRARERVVRGRSASVSPAKQQRLLNAFVAAATRGELAALERLLAADVVSHDGRFGRAARIALPPPPERSPSVCHNPSPHSV